jgi:hypothetical protein
MLKQSCLIEQRVEAGMHLSAPVALSMAAFGEASDMKRAARSLSRDYKLEEGQQAIRSEQEGSHVVYLSRTIAHPFSPDQM